MTGIRIVVREDGPYKVEGEVRVVDAAGNELPFEAPLALCRCGSSENKPFCDASHKRLGFKSSPAAE